MKENKLFKEFLLDIDIEKNKLIKLALKYPNDVIKKEYCEAQLSCLNRVIFMVELNYLHNE